VYSMGTRWTAYCLSVRKRDTSVGRQYWPVPYYLCRSQEGGTGYSMGTRRAAYCLRIKKTSWRKGAEVQVWDAITGQHLCTYTGHKDDVTALLWSLPDGWRIASSSHDERVEVWEASKGQHVTTYILTPYSMEGRKGRRRVVEALAWAPDGQRIVFCGGEFSDELEVWEADTGRTVAHTRVSGVHGWWGLSVVWAPDGKNIALISDGKVQIHGADLASSITYTYEGKKGALAWMLDGWRVAMASHDGTIRVW